MISNKDNNKNPTLETGQIITLAGHSGGGLRNYLALLNSNPNQYLNSSGESVLQVQFSGTPVNNQDLILASQLAGAYFVVSQNKTPTIDNNLFLNAKKTMTEKIEIKRIYQTNKQFLLTNQPINNHENKYIETKIIHRNANNYAFSILSSFF